MEKKIFTSTVENGIMSGADRFYSSEMSREEIKQELLDRRKKLGELCGFDGSKIFVSVQKNNNNSKKYVDGKYVVLKREMFEGISDYWDLDIDTDIAIVTKKDPGIVLAHPVADCPVVIMEDVKHGYTALAHCGGEYIDRYLPMQVADSLLYATNARDEDIKVHVGPCAGFRTFSYDCYPSWAKNGKIWSENINMYFDNLYYINMRRAIFNQLLERGIKRDNIYFDPADTITDSRFYSNHEAKNNPEKDGRFLVGTYYEGKPKVKLLDRIRG